MNEKPINPDLQAAAVDLVDALLWLANDALAMRRLPVYDPSIDPDLGPTFEVAALQAFYLPHRRLPEAGQNCWRKIQGVIDLRFFDRPTDGQTPSELLVRFQESLDAMLTWLAVTYKLMPEIPDKGRPKPKKIGAREGIDWKKLRKDIFIRMCERLYNTDDELQYKLYTQDELADELGFSQSTINRAVRRMFKGKGREGYRNFVEDYRGNPTPGGSMINWDGSQVGADESDDEELDQDQPGDE